jgi:hypothetical protein
LRLVRCTTCAIDEDPFPARAERIGGRIDRESIAPHPVRAAEPCAFRGTGLAARRSCVSRKNCGRVLVGGRDLAPSGCMLSRAWLVLVVAAAAAGCNDRRSASSPSGAPFSRDAAPHRIDDPDCAADRDCVLMPWITCCGECEPAPPFEAGTRVELDGILIESEMRCARDDRPCAPPVCGAVPRGCEARAACVGGRCVVLQNGCDPATLVP